MTRARNRSGQPVDRLDAATTLGIKIGVAGFVIAMAYFVYGVTFGGLQDFAKLGLAEQNRVLSNLWGFGDLLMASCLLVTLCVCVKYRSDQPTGYILLVLGLLLYVGSPFLFSDGTRAPSAAVQFITRRFVTVGIVPLVAAVPFVMIDLLYKITGRRASKSRRAAIQVAQKPADHENHIYAKCWEMPFCREYLRQFCKSHKEKKSCWRLKSGCFCDEDMIVRALELEMSAKGAKKPIPRRQMVAKGLTAKQKVERCRKCRIYAEHQNQKYRLLSPLAFILPFAFIAYKPELVNSWLSVGLEFADRFLGRLSFDSQSGTTAAAKQFAESISGSNIAMWVVTICVMLTVVTWLLKVIEYLVYDRQL